MVEPAEIAQEHIQEAHHEHGGSDPWPRQVAIVVSCLAAALAIAEIGAKSSQTAYLTHNIALSDTWAFYQAKNLRAALRNSQASMLESLPGADNASIQARLKTARDEETRMRDDPAGDGMKQLRAKAVDEEKIRDHAFHAYHGYEYTTGALEIAIVLASVSVVTKMKPLGYAAGLIGLLACAFGLTVYGEVF